MVMSDGLMPLSLPYGTGAAIRSLPQSAREVPPIFSGLGRLEGRRPGWTIGFHPYEKEEHMSDIVVGIDATPGARDALAFATRLAECTGASVRLPSRGNPQGPAHPP